MSTQSFKIISFQIGPKNSGKSETLKRLLLDSERYFYHPIVKIIYFYSFYQTVMFDEIRKKFGDNVQFIPADQYNGLAFFSAMKPFSPPLTLIFDDMDSILMKNRETKDIVDILLHHLSINLFIVSHSLVSNRKMFLEISKNADMMILFDNFRARYNVRCLSRSMFNCPNLIQDALDCMNSNLPALVSYSFPVLLDFRTGVKPFLRARTVLFEKSGASQVISPLPQC